jgi:hypothetical protein
MLKTACRRLAQQHGPAAAAPFSSVPLRRPEAFQFNQERQKFNQEMSLKRKAYAAEVAARVAEEKQRVKDERATIVAAKLERLQIKIERSRIRAQSVAIERVLAASGILGASPTNTPFARCDCKRARAVKRCT